MAIYVFTDGDLVVNGVNLSDHVDTVEVALSREDVTLTAMGASGVARRPGLRDESFTVTFLQDFAASEVDATLNGLYINGTSHTVTAKPTSAAVSATNPSYSATVYLLEYTPIQGQVGSGAQATATFVVDGVITRATA